MLTSLIWLLDADRFCSVDEIASEVYWRRFWTAPSVAACVEIASIAQVRLVRAVLWLRSTTVLPAPQLVNPAAELSVPSTLENVAVSVSAALAPTWKVTVPEPPAFPLSRLMLLKSDEVC